LKTENYDKIANSELFVVTALNDDTFEVKRVLKRVQREAFVAHGRQDLIDAAESERITLRYVDIGSKRDEIGFHRVFQPGYCITAHKAQGDTFEERYTIYDFNHPHMVPYGRYVAFTRGTSIESVQINVTLRGTEQMVREIEARYEGMGHVAKKQRVVDEQMG